MLAVATMLSGQTPESFTMYFDFNKYALTEASLLQIDSCLNANKNRPSKYQLEGHCDSTGSDHYNLVLSGKRVGSVQEYMQHMGVQKTDFILLKGYGKRQPLNGNITEEERQVNRRVVVTVIRSENTGSLKEKIADTNTISGTTIVLRNINFFGGRHQFLPESFPALNELLVAMGDFPRLVIQVEGHICCEPGDIDGMDFETGTRTLSHERAKAVRDYLLENGIDSSRISYRGYGHSRPLYPYPENSEEERVQNRRVEIKIIRK
jgi:outer membrane protein OmpA-like peptidoglycan-associated protein